MDNQIIFVEDRPAIINANILQCSKCRSKFAYEDYTSFLTVNINFCPLCGCYFSNNMKIKIKGDNI